MTSVSPAELSVLICTYNRSPFLRDTLGSLARVTVPPGLAWEVVVVDNNSTDGTAGVCEEFAAQLPIRCIREERPGKSCALNRGIVEAAGEVVLFTDDDVLLAPEWMAALLDGVRRFPQAGFYGGPVIPHWDSPPPAWLKDNADWLWAVCGLTGGETATDFGNDRNAVGLIGCNWACRRELLREGMRFNEAIGPRGSDGQSAGRVGCEENDVQRRLLDSGVRGAYLPRMLVHHRYATRRMNLNYIRTWYRGHGRAAVRLGEVRMERLLWGVPLYWWRAWPFCWVRYTVTRWTCPSRTWLQALADLSRATGIIEECRQSRAAIL